MQAKAYLLNFYLLKKKIMEYYYQWDFKQLWFQNTLKDKELPVEILLMFP